MQRFNSSLTEGDGANANVANKNMKAAAWSSTKLFVPNDAGAFTNTTGLETNTLPQQQQQEIAVIGAEDALAPPLPFLE